MAHQLVVGEVIAQRVQGSGASVVVQVELLHKLLERNQLVGSFVLFRRIDDLPATRTNFGLLKQLVEFLFRIGAQQIVKT